MPRTTTIDLQDRIDEIKDQIDDLDETITEVADLYDRVEGVDASEQLEDHEDVANTLAEIFAGEETDADLSGFDETTIAEVRSLLEEEHRALKKERLELERAIERIEGETKRWGGSQVTIKEMNYGDQGMRNDLVRGDMSKKGDDDPAANLSAQKLRTIQVGTKQLPGDAPDDPSEFEPPVGEYLYRCIDNLNTYGQVSLPDFSL